MLIIKLIIYSTTKNLTEFYLLIHRLIQYLELDRKVLQEWNCYFGNLLLQRPIDKITKFGMKHFKGYTHRKFIIDGKKHTNHYLDLLENYETLIFIMKLLGAFQRSLLFKVKISKSKSPIYLA